jgi:sulfite exporter TauE/SafE
MTFGLPESVRQSYRAILPYQFAYNLGRIASYVVAGAIMGGLGRLLAQALPFYYAQRGLLLLAGVFMILLGLYLGGWWFGLSRIEKLGGSIWSRLEPFSRRLLPVKSRSQALLLGVLWGWIPCGLVYSMLVWAVASGGVVSGAMLMSAFALGTLPNLLAMGLVAGTLSRWTRKPWVKYTAGVMVILFGIYNIWQAI